MICLLDKNAISDLIIVEQKESGNIMGEDIFMYWLSTLYKLGSRKQNLLLEYFGMAHKIFWAEAGELRMVSGITEHNVHTILKGRGEHYIDQIDHELHMLERMGIRFIPRGHHDFPALLNEIPDPPVGLYSIGTLPPANMQKVSIIGSRKCSEYGLTTAQRFGDALAKQGSVVVSGMARGIDSMAHRGAIESGGLTIAVLGNGVDICYPAENRSLRDRIIKSGCVISEYPPGVTPHASHFPARNRIISGLSRVLVVVEAGKKSGTLITVDQALEQGRDVMAVPGNITNKYSEGTNDLIKQGAYPACSHEDVLHILDTTGKVNYKTSTNSGETIKKDIISKDSVFHIAPEEKLVYDVLDFEPIALDEIIIKTNSQPQTIQYILTTLELKGYVQKLPGMRYIKR